MSGRNPGVYVQIKEGIHAQKRGFSYNREQLPEIVKKGKVCVWVPDTIQTSLFPDMETGTWKKVLFDKEKLKIIGFID